MNPRRFFLILFVLACSMAAVSAQPAAHQRTTQPNRAAKTAGNF